MRRSIAIHQGHRILGNGKPHSFLSKVYLVNILLIALWLKTTESLQCQLVKRRPWSFTIVFTSRRLGGVIISCELFLLQGSCFKDISQGTGESNYLLWINNMYCWWRNMDCFWNGKLKSDFSWHLVRYRNLWKNQAIFAIFARTETNLGNNPNTK